MRRLSPIVFFAYNRPQHTRNALASLAENAEARSSELYIYCDAPPRGATQAVCDAVEQTRRVVRERQWCGHVQILEAPVNLGCDGSMLLGIESIVKSHGRVIVLEDDLIVGRYWLSFLNRGLAVYEGDERVGAISGFMYPIVHRSLPRTFFSCFLNFWGWATWKSAWDMFQPNASVLLRGLSESGLLDRYMLGRPEYLRYLIELQGRRDSYDILWYATLLTQQKLVLYPGQSLVANRGFDLSGTHLAILDEPNLAFMDHPVSDVELNVERQPVLEDKSATDAVIEANSYIWP